MKIKNLNQRTPEWHIHRQKYINATDVASIIGKNPFKSMQQLVNEKLFGIKTTFTTNKYIEYGTKMEPIAREYFIRKTKLPFLEAVFVDDNKKIFSASIDGYNEKHKIILEIKCPFFENNKISKKWDEFVKIKKIPEYYYAQLQCQLFCSNAKFTYFFVYLSELKNYTVCVKPNKEFFDLMISKSEEYLEFLEKAKQELSNSVYLKKLIQINEI